jgi:hypothetical protein
LGETSIWNGIVEVFDSVINPNILSVETAASQYSTIVVIAMGLIMCSAIRMTFKDASKHWVLGASIVITFLAATVKQFGEIWIIIGGVFGSVLKMIGGASLVFNAFNRKVVGVTMLVLLAAATFIGMILVKQMPFDSLVLLKLMLSVFSGIGVYNFFISQDLELRFGKEWAIGMAVLIGFVGLISFDGFLVLSRGSIFGKIANDLLFHYAFATGLVVGFFAWIGNRN